MFQNVLMNLFERISSTGEEHHSFGGNIRVIPVFGESTDAAECRRQRNRKFLFQPEDQLLYAIDGRVVIYRQKDYNYIFAAKSCDSDIFTIKILVKKLGNTIKTMPNIFSFSAVYPDSQRATVSYGSSISQIESSRCFFMACQYYVSFIVSTTALHRFL